MQRSPDKQQLEQEKQLLIQRMSKLYKQIDGMRLRITVIDKELDQPVINHQYDSRTTGTRN